MTRTEFACQRYRQIRPAKWGRTTQRILQVWFEDDACAAIEEYWLRSSFQEQAAWSVRNLTNDSSSPERSRIEKLNSLLIQAGQRLKKVGSQPGLAKKLRQQNPPKAMVTEETVEIEASALRVLDRKVAAVDELEIEKRQIAQVAARFWPDLVLAEDYFSPLGGWHTEGKVQSGEFIPSVNPELHMAGDFIIRGALRRVGSITDTIDSFSRKCRSAAGRSVPKALRDFEEVRKQIKEEVRFLRGLLDSPVGLLRDACVIMAQVYVAVRDMADTTWLGLPERVIQTGGWSVQGALRHLKLEAYDRLANALNEVKRLDRGKTPAQTAIEEAIATGGLVLTAAPEAYWSGQMIDADWKKRRRPWELLQALARKKKAGSFASERDIFETSPSLSTLSTIKGRLVQLLPPLLAGKIAPGPERGTYTLTLDPAHIHLFNSTSRQ